MYILSLMALVKTEYDGTKVAEIIFRKAKSCKDMTKLFRKRLQ